MTSISYDPSAYGVEIITSIDPEEAYQFNTILVVRSIETGKLYAAHDSGCSCPTPFEDTKFPSDFVHISALSDINTMIREYYGDESALPADRVANFKGEVRQALRKLAAGKRSGRPRLEFSCSEEYKPLGGLYGSLPGLAAEYPHLAAHETRRVDVRQLPDGKWSWAIWVNGEDHGGGSAESSDAAALMFASHYLTERESV